MFIDFSFNQKFKYLLNFYIDQRIMHKYKQKPIHLISVDENQKYKVNEEALAIIASIAGKIAIISVAGMYRTGKSYLLNRMLLNRSDGFGVGPTINPCTKGLWIWGKPIIHRTPNDQIINILIIDSEGLGALDEDNNHDAKIFSLTLLLSSCFIYNSMGSIDQIAINNLGLVVNLSKFLKIRANEKSEPQQQHQDYFPNFYWVVRDFSLQLINKQGKPISGKQYLENALNQQKNSEYTQNRNQIRKAIKKYFNKRDCITLVRPLTNEQNLQILEKLEFDSLRPEFIEQVLNFRKTIFNNLKYKSINKKSVNGKIFCNLITSYITAINNGGIPVIQTTWKYICKQECQKGLEEALMYLQNKSIQKIKKKMPMPISEFKKIKKQIIQQIKQIYQKLTQNNQQRESYEKILEEKMKQRLNNLRSDNEIENVKGTQNFITNQFNYIDRKIKSNQYKKIGQFIKEIQLFYEYYKKKCNFQQPKSNIYMLEFLLKKFTEASIMISKSMSQDIQNLKIQYKESQTKFQKEKQNLETKNLKEKSEVLEKISELEKTKSDLVFKVQNQLDEIQRLKKQISNIVKQKQTFQSNIKKENNKIINELKINIHNLEIAKDQKQNQYNQLMSRFETEGLLQKNKFEYYQKNIQEIQNRYKQAQNINKLMKVEHQKMIKQVENKYQVNKTNLQIKINNLENMLEERSNEIKNMEQDLIESNSRKQQLQIYVRNFKEQTQKNINKLKQQFKSNKQLQLEKIKRQSTQNLNDLDKKLKKLESQLNGKQSNFKLLKLESEKQQALLKQKIEFGVSELNQKEKKIEKMNEEYHNLINIIQNKDQTINKLESKYNQLKDSNFKMIRKLESTNQGLSQQIEQYTLKFEQITKIYQEQKTKVQELQIVKSNLQKNQMKLIEQIKIFESNRNQILLQRELKYQQQIKKFQEEFDNEKQENRIRIQEIKKNSETSLIQLKNFYEIQKQRLQKRVLEQRKKVEHIQNQTLTQIQEDHRKYKQYSENEISKLREEIKISSTKYKGTQSQYQKKIEFLKEKSDSLEKQKVFLQDTLQKKEISNKEELKKINKEFQDQRISFIRKIQTITSQMSKKEKQILQLYSKKENNQAIMLKKEQLIQQLNKQHSQQIKSLIQSNEQLKIRLFKIRDQYMELKIQSEKQIALTKQKNQFLSNKVAQLVKQREINSSKNLIERPHDKSEAMKQQLEKYLSEITILQGKLEKNKKSIRQSQNNYHKQISQLQREKSYMSDKISQSEDRFKQLQLKLNQKTQQYLKDLEDIRQKNSTQRNYLLNEMDRLKSSLNEKINQKNQIQSKANRQQALLEQKIKFFDYQKEQLKKELQENRKKLQFTMNQLHKNRKSDEDEDFLKQTNHVEKKYLNQIQSLKDTLKKRSEEYDQNISKLKGEIRINLQKNKQLQQKMLKNQKLKKMDEMLLYQNEQLKKERDQLFLTHKAQLSKQNQENRKKIAQIQKKYKVIEKKNAQFNFLLEKEHAKWMMQRDSLLDKINQLEQALKQKSNLQKSMEQRSFTDLKKSLMSDKQKRRNTIQDTLQLKKSYQFDFNKK